MLTRTYKAACLFDIRHPLFELQASQHTVSYSYQLILVCQIRDNPAIVSIQFLKGIEDRVFCMAFTRFLASSVMAKIAAAAR